MKRTISIAFVLLCCTVFGFSQNKTKIKNETAPQGVKVGKFGPLLQVCAGVNIHFVTGHEKDLDLIAAAGFKFVRIDFGWQGTERTKGSYNWAAFDELTENLEKRGLRGLYILDYSNSNYEQTTVAKDPISGKDQKSTASPQHPESVAAFASWAAAAAEHFNGKNIIWEIWNEPNISFWKPKPEVAQYTALALATCKAVKAAVPDATIIGPASSETPWPFLESFLACGVLEYLDAVSIHPYRNSSKSPETAAVDYLKLRALIEKYASADKKNLPIISSEWGYSTATSGVSLDTQAAYIVRMQLSNLLSGIPISIWYDWKNDGDDLKEHEHNFGSVTSDLKPKPSYTAIQTMNKLLSGFSLVQRIDLKNDRDYALLFKNDKGEFRLCAWTVNPAHAVTIDQNIPKIKRVTVTDGYGNVLKAMTDKNKLVLELVGLPQYIVLPKGFAVN